MRPVWALLLLLAWASGCGSPRAVAPPPPPPEPVVPTPPITCRPEVGSPAPAAAGSDVHCVIDVGSRNVKLVVASARAGDPKSLANLRQCRSRLQLSDKTRDPQTGLGRPLALPDQHALLAVIRTYAGICRGDKGRLHAAVATEWARHASNIDDISKLLVDRTGVAIDVLSRKEEARAAYLAATRGQRGKLVLDFGSRSLQLAFWATDAAEPEVRSAPLGMDELGDRFFAQTPSYEKGRKALIEALRTSLGPMLTMARRAIRRGTVTPELYSLGENGDLSLATVGALWSGTPPRATDEPGYAAAVKALPRPDPLVGLPLSMGAVRTLTTAPAENPLLFEDLRSPDRRRVFGNKMLVFPAMTVWLRQELGLTKLVLLPQEMADGVLVAALTAPVSRN